jgi:hypothetical protein
MEETAQQQHLLVTTLFPNCSLYTISRTNLNPETTTTDDNLVTISTNPAQEKYRQWYAYTHNHTTDDHDRSNVGRNRRQQVPISLVIAVYGLITSDTPFQRGGGNEV